MPIRADCTNSRLRTFLLYGVVCPVLLSGCSLQRQQVSEVQYIDGCYYSWKTVSSTIAGHGEKDFMVKNPCEIKVGIEADQESDNDNNW